MRYVSTSMRYVASLSICESLQYCIYNFLATDLAVLTSVTPPINIEALTLNTYILSSKHLRIDFMI